MAEPAGDGPAVPQAELWGERARDWADVIEGWNGWAIPLYRHILERVPVGPGTRLLDVGCGAGRFCRIAADRGADVSALDATGPLLEIARERVLDGDFRLGDMHELPWPDDTFDVVTGFNSFFLADDMVAALREARRVARPGGHVATTCFGRPERSQLTRVLGAVNELLPEPPPAPAPDPGDDGDRPPLHGPGGLEAVAAEAGLTPVETGYFETVERYRDLETMVRGFLAPPPMRRAARAVGEDAVSERLAEVLREFEQPDGRVQTVNELRYLVATA